MNFHDSERMAGLLEQAGFEAATEAADADVVVINTCSVRERAEEKLYTRLGELRQLANEHGHDPIVAIAGCVAQQEGAALLKRSPGVADVVIGTQAIRRLPMLVEAALDRKAGRRSSISTRTMTSRFRLGVTRRGDPLKAYVTIIEGCNEFCSFCVVPYTRGHERMRPKADILAEVREPRQAGVARCSCSARSSTTTPRRTTRRATSRGCSKRSTRWPASSASASPVRIHGMSTIGSSTRWSGCRRSAGTCICRCSRDRRRCCSRCAGATPATRYLALVEQIRERLPEVALSTDMIVGFPTETAADFEETLTLTSMVRYHSMFSFKYSPRPNTLAEQRLPDTVTEDEKTRRIVALQALQRDIQSELNAATRRAHGRRPGGCGQPAARHGTVRPNEHERRRQSAGSDGLDRPADAGGD